MRAAEAERWEGSTDAELSARLGAAEVLERLEEHARSLVEIQRALYLETARDNIAPSTAAPPMLGMPPGAKVSLFRVKPHLERLERAMARQASFFAREVTRCEHQGHDCPACASWRASRVIIACSDAPACV